MAVRIGSFLFVVCGDSARRAVSDRFEEFRGWRRIRATVADALRFLRVEDDSVGLWDFACETLAVLFIAGGCVSGAGSAVAESGGAGSVLTVEVV
jgi:hypothetical protein